MFLEFLNRVFMAPDDGGGDGGRTAGTVEDWRTQLPADLQEAPQLKDVKDVGALAKQFVDQQRYLGNSIRIPGEDASPEQRQDFLAKLHKHADGKLVPMPNPEDPEAMAAFWGSVGVPSDHNNYTIDDSVDFDADRLDTWKKEAKKYGLTQKAFRQFVNDQLVVQKEQAEKGRQLQNQDMQELQTDWGQATQARLNDIQKFAQVMDLPKNFQEALADNQVGSQWLKPLWRIIEQFGGMGEGKEVAFQPGGSIPDSPAELKAKIAEIEANPALMDQRHPQHKVLVQKRFELFKQLEDN